MSKEGFIRNQTKHCRGNVPYHQLILGMSRQFMERYSDRCHLSVSTSLHEMMHDSPVDGELVDLDLTDFLARLNKGPTLNHSMLVILGDHGHRIQRIKYTYLGQIEERTAFLAIWFPEWFRRKYPHLMQIMAENGRQQLTNHFDLYETFRDVIDNTLDNSAVLKDRPGRLHGRSLFQSISPERNCETADIPPQFCICLTPIGRLDARNESSLAAYRSMLSDWLVKNGWRNVSEIRFVQVQLYSTNQLVQHMIRHMGEKALESLKQKKEGDIEFVEVVAKLKPGNRWIQAQIQHTNSSKDVQETFQINRAPVISDAS